MFVRSFVVRPRGQTKRGIKRERTLRTATDLVYKDPQPRARREGAPLVEKDKRRLGGRTVGGRERGQGGEGGGGKDAHV